MTQRLTHEREAEIRRDDAGYATVSFPDTAVYQRRELLAEITALRAELAGAEERGRQKERSRCVDIAAREAGLETDQDAQDKLFALVAMLHSPATDEILRKHRDAAGTTPPDAGESGP